MVNWTSEPQPFGANHAPLIEGLSSVDGITPVPIAVDPSTGALLSNATITPSGIQNTHELTGMIPEIYDAVTYTATSSTVDTYRFYTGGTGGTLVSTLTVTYTDSTHTILVSAVRT